MSLKFRLNIAKINICVLLSQVFVDTAVAHYPAAVLECYY
jgi:hypothetical protein